MLSEVWREEGGYIVCACSRDCGGREGRVACEGGREKEGSREEGGERENGVYRRGEGGNAYREKSTLGCSSSSAQCTGTVWVGLGVLHQVSVSLPLFLPQFIHGGDLEGRDLGMPSLSNGR